MDWLIGDLEKRFRVNLGNNEFVKECKHVNGIKFFWSYVKHRLASFMACGATSLPCISRRSRSASITAILIFARPCLN